MKPCCTVINEDIIGWLGRIKLSQTTPDEGESRSSSGQLKQYMYKKKERLGGKGEGERQLLPIYMPNANYIRNE